MKTISIRSRRGIAGSMYFLLTLWLVFSVLMSGYGNRGVQTSGFEFTSNASESDALWSVEIHQPSA